jgi:hypothetical protein
LIESTPRRAWVLALFVAALFTAAFAVERAHGAGLAGRLADGKVPAPGAGAAVVRAVNPLTGLIVAASDVRANGTWSLRLPNGRYTVLATVVPLNGPIRTATSPIVQARGAKPTRLRVSLRRQRAPKVPRRTQKARIDFGNAPTPGAPVIAVKALDTTAPTPGYVGKGMADLLITDLVSGSEQCTPRVREYERIADVEAEIAFSNSKYGDPATRIPRGQLLTIDLFVEGSIANGADGSRSWTLRLRDASTGKTVGGDSVSLPPGGDFMEAEEQSVRRLLDQICGGSYDINLTLRTDANFATHTASGTLNTTFTARGSNIGKSPPQSFTGSGPPPTSR